MDYLRYSTWNVKRIGKKDGKRLIWFLIPKTLYPPDNEEEPSSFEKEIAAFIKKKIAKIGEKWKKIDAKLFARCKDLLENKIKKIKDSLFTTKKELEEANSCFRNVQAEFQELPGPSCRPPWSWFLFFGLFIGDLFFNGVVFEVFGQSRFETALIAFATVVAVSLIPHFIGRKLKNEERTELESRLTIAVAISLLVGILAIGWIRMKYLVSSEYLKWSPLEVFFIFVGINYLVSVAFVILGHISGHKYPTQYRKVKTKFKEANKERKKKAKKLKELQKEDMELETQFFETHSERLAAYQRLYTKLVGLTQKGISLVEAYRGANVRSRGKTPKCFEIKAELLLKPSETSLQLDCNECLYYQWQKWGSHLDLMLNAQQGG